jgi:hypothetical protein
MRSICRALAVAAFVTMACPVVCLAQTKALDQLDIVLAVESGPIKSTLKDRGIVYAEQVHIAGAPWIRLKFDQAILGEHGPNGSASLLRITSMLDGGQQLMNAAHLQQWSYTSAYFNGDTVLVEVIADPDAAPSHISINHAWAGLAPEPGGGIASLCGVDNRVLSNDPAQGRLFPIGCTAWLFNDFNRTFLTAGHCTNSAGSVVQFNVPLSNANGSLNHPPPQHQYPVDLSSVQFTNGGAGNDWQYFGCFANSTTGLTAYQAQQAFYTLAAAPPAVQNPAQPIRVTGYGTVSSPVSLTWNQVQKTHVAPYSSFVGTLIRYIVDTTGGNSGSPVVDENQQRAIGIHTHAGCTTGGNQGTAINHSGLVNALAHPLGVCIPVAFSLQSSPGTQTVCAPADAVYSIAVNLGASGAPVNMSISGVPAGANAGFSVNPVTPGNSTTLTISNTAGANPAVYIMQVTGNNGSVSQFTNVTLNLAGVLNPPDLSLPSDGATGVELAPTFEWDASPNAQSYDIQIAINPTFTPALYAANVVGTSHDGPTLAASTLHYWRVRPNSFTCGSGAYSSAFSFTTDVNPKGCPEDVSGDGTVDMADLLAVIAAWGQAGGPADVNGDNLVDINDLLDVIAAWGSCA